MILCDLFDPKTTVIKKIRTYQCQLRKEKNLESEIERDSLSNSKGAVQAAPFSSSLFHRFKLLMSSSFSNIKKPGTSSLSSSASI